MAKSTRTLFVDIGSLFAVIWLWIAVYESFTRSGLWLVLARLVGGATTLPSEAALLATCVLIGWLVLAACSWGASVAVDRIRALRDFPAARLLS